MAFVNALLGAVHTKSDAAAKTQRFPFIFSGTPCGTTCLTFAADLYSICGWTHIYIFVFFSVFIRHIPCHAAAANHLTPLQHGELQDYTVMLMSCCGNYTRPRCHTIITQSCLLSSRGRIWYKRSRNTACRTCPLTLDCCLSAAECRHMLV